PGQSCGEVRAPGPDRRQRDSEAGLGELRLRRVREVAGEGEPVQELDLQSGLQAFAVRRALGLGRALVADEDELALEIQEPVGEEELRARQDARAEAELVAGRGR